MLPRQIHRGFSAFHIIQAISIRRAFGQVKCDDPGRIPLRRREVLSASGRTEVALALGCTRRASRRSAPSVATAISAPSWAATPRPEEAYPAAGAFPRQREILSDRRVRGAARPGGLNRETNLEEQSLAG